MTFNDVVPAFLAACPGIGPAWEQHLESWGGSADRGVYNDVAVAAHHIASHRPFGPFVFLDWLGPQSRSAWDELCRFWQLAGAWTSVKPHLCREDCYSAELRQGEKGFCLR